jgi:uncharacterized protein (TIGR02147 family)
MNKLPQHETLLKYTNYKDVLRSELAKRQLRFSNYSLRDFAVDIALAPSTLSEIFSGKHELSRRKAEHIGQRMGFETEGLNYFCDLVESVSARSAVARDAAKERIERRNGRSDSHYIGQEEFHIIADWYHLAILELVRLGKFDGTSSSLARTLGITEHQVDMAIERLKKVGVLKFKDGQLITIVRNTKTTDEVPAEAVKLFHKQMLTKAQQALVNQDVGDREIASIVLSINKKDLPEAKKMLKEFRRRFCTVMEESDHPSEEVYCLNTSFFSLHKPEMN